MNLKNSGEGGILRNILKGIGELVELVQEMDTEGKTEIRRTGNFGGFPERKGISGRYDFTLKMGLPGKRGQVAGDAIHADSGRKSSMKEIEPELEVHDEGSFIRVVMEIPAVPDEEVAVCMVDNVLYIDIKNGEAAFRKSIALPDKVKPATMRKYIRNSILEILIDVQDQVSKE